MKSLLKESNGRHWYPKPIDVYKANLKLPRGVFHRNQLASNFAYNMQYLEYIQKQLEELRLSSVLIAMLYKTYIIVAIGIIEMLFTTLLKSKKLWKTSKWELLLSTKSNPQKYNGKKLKSETLIYEEVDEYCINMDFDSMLKKIEDKDLLSLPHKLYPKLKQLKKLRNRVHLQECSSDSDHDYNNFEYEDYCYMKKVLHYIITCEEFCKNKELYKFLQVKKEPQALILGI